MLDNTFLDIKTAISDLETVWLWLERMCAAKMHIVRRCLCRAWAAGPVISVVDAHRDCPAENMNVLRALAGLRCVEKWFEAVSVEVK